jgi:hypothetical protein
MATSRPPINGLRVLLLRFRTRWCPLDLGTAPSSGGIAHAQESYRPDEVVQSNHGLWIYSTEGGGGKNVFVHVSAVEFY